MTTTQQVAEPAFEALREYLTLRDELCTLEDREGECSCDYNNFHTCSFHELLGDKTTESRRLMNVWGETWALLLNKHTLPFQVWCNCGHISGQHGINYPHACAVSGGCEKDCYGFRSKLYDAAPELLRVLKESLPQIVWANIHGSRCDELIAEIELAISKAERGQ